MSIEDRRSAPRFAVSFKGTVTSIDGQVSSIEVSNISASGLQLNIAQSELPGIIPNTLQTNNLTPVQIELKFELPNNERTIRIRCGIVYIKKISMEYCNVGCRFEQFFEQCDQYLESYIKQFSAYSERQRLTDE